MKREREEKKLIRISVLTQLGLTNTGKQAGRQVKVKERLKCVRGRGQTKGRQASNWLI